MQGIIDEGSDHIQDLEQKVKTQGKGQKNIWDHIIWNHQVEMRMV